MSELAEQKGCPFRVTTKNACIYGILDNHKKGAIVWASIGGDPEKEEKDDRKKTARYSKKAFIVAGE